MHTTSAFWVFGEKTAFWVFGEKAQLEKGHVRNVIADLSRERSRPVVGLVGLELVIPVEGRVTRVECVDTLKAVDGLVRLTALAALAAVTTLAANVALLALLAGAALAFLAPNETLVALVALLACLHFSVAHASSSLGSPGAFSLRASLLSDTCVPSMCRVLASRATDHVTASAVRNCECLLDAANRAQGFIRLILLYIRRIIWLNESFENSSLHIYLLQYKMVWLNND